MNADDVHYLGDETLSCNLFTYCMNNIVNNLDWNGKGLHLGKHWYNSKTWIMRFVAIAIAFTGFSFSGFISKGIIKGVKGMSKAVVRDLKYKVKNKLQKIVYLIARKMQRNVIKSAVSSQINRVINTLFALTNFSVENAIFEAIDRIDGRNDNYWFA